LYFVLLTFTPIFYNFFNPNETQATPLPMQSSPLQTGFFICFLLAIATIASILPCGRYYYEPEGGYGGNP
jgi:ABC-type lipoprotein release transport system permease subunit